MASQSRLQKLVEPNIKSQQDSKIEDSKIEDSGVLQEEDDDEQEEPTVLEPKIATNHRPSPSIQVQMKEQFDLELQPRSKPFQNETPTGS